MNRQLYEHALRTNLSLFIQKTFATVDPGANYMHNWHIDVISEYLEACRKKELKRLIINIPPGYLKSISVNVAFPAWLLGHNPSERIISSSYAESLSLKHSVDSRLVIESDWYKRLFPDTEMAPDQNEKRKFMTTQRGFRVAASTGGAITGDGGNFLIVDDPHNVLQAESDVQRQSGLDWFDRTFTSRLRDKKEGVIIVIMQRLHQLDLTGHLLEKGGYEHLSLPAVAEKKTIIDFGRFKDKPIIREEGDLLHPEREGEEEIERVKRELGPYGFAGQYQQTPTPMGGGELRKEWLQFYDKIDHTQMNIYMLVDPANSKRKKSDYTAIAIWGAAKDRNLYLVDAYRDRLNVKEREDLIFMLHEKYKPKIVGIEKYGMQTDADWLRKAMEDRQYRFSIDELGGTMSKEDRIRRLIPMLAEGRIYLPKQLIRANDQKLPVDVIDEFINQEYVPFPVGMHDDMLDAMSRVFDVNVLYPGSSNINYYDLYA